MKLGTATSVLYLYTLRDAIPLIAEIGFDGVDIWGGRPHVYRQDYSPAELKELCQIITGHGLSVSSFMPAFYRYPHSLSNPNPKVRQDSIDYMRQCIDNAAILGARVVLIVPDLSLVGQARLDSRQRLIESIDVCARYASQYELKLGIEVLHFDETDLVNTSDDAIGIIHELGHANLGVVLDTGTLNLSKEDPQEAVAKLSGLLLQVHVNDNHGGHKQQNLIPGEGTYNFRELIQVLQKDDYSGFLSAELSKEYSDDPMPALRKTVERLKAWMHENTETEFEFYHRD
jgi:fructoselysine 3-epimerase